MGRHLRTMCNMTPAELVELERLMWLLANNPEKGFSIEAEGVKEWALLSKGEPVFRTTSAFELLDRLTLLVERLEL